MDELRTSEALFAIFAVSPWQKLALYGHALALIRSSGFCVLGCGVVCLDRFGK